MVIGTSPKIKLPGAPTPDGRTHVIQDGRRLSYFGGCDYFRLASHPGVLRAAREGVKQFGMSVSASRITTGNHPLYLRLERRLAEFFGAETAILAGNGSAPNYMVAQALAGQFSHALLDERAHPSVQDSARFLDCPILKFKHRDASDLSRILERLGKVCPLVLTDGMFSHDGGVAPLKEFLAVLPPGGKLLVDDAHGAGVLGATGRGAVQFTGLRTPQIILTISLSKAFGVYGGAVLGPRTLADAIVARSAVFTGSTPLPLPLAFAAIKSVAILKAGGALRKRLARNISYLRARLREHGIPVTDTPGPIFAMVPKNSRETARLTRRLLDAGIHPPLTKYPGGPAAVFFRFVISSEHKAHQLDQLAKAVSNAGIAAI